VGKQPFPSNLRAAADRIKLEDMTVELKPETERLIEEELRSGRVDSVDELIVHGVNAVRQKSDLTQTASKARRKSLYELLTEPPFHGSELNLERQKDSPRPLDL
jgi:Arc/MetJ-type ribon-helix-helix transcriptional regulator